MFITGNEKNIKIITKDGRVFVGDIFDIVIQPCDDRLYTVVFIRQNERHHEDDYGQASIFLVNILNIERL